MTTYLTVAVAGAALFVGLVFGVALSLDVAREAQEQARLCMAPTPVPDYSERFERPAWLPHGRDWLASERSL